jgi:two-component system, response regulator YesN
MYTAVIIDDEPQIRTGIRKRISLTQQIINVVGEAESYEDGLELIREQQPDVAFVDIRLEGKDGLELIETSFKISPETKYIIISGYADFRFAKRGIQLGVVDYLTKPVDQKTFSAAVKKCLTDVADNPKRKILGKEDIRFMKALQAAVLPRERDTQDFFDEKILADYIIEYKPIQGLLFLKLDSTGVSADSIPIPDFIDVSGIRLVAAAGSKTEHILLVPSTFTGGMQNAVKCLKEHPSLSKRSFLVCFDKAVSAIETLRVSFRQCRIMSLVRFIPDMDEVLFPVNLPQKSRYNRDEKGHLVTALGKALELRNKDESQKIIRILFSGKSFNKDNFPLIEDNYLKCVNLFWNFLSGIQERLNGKFPDTLYSFPSIQEFCDPDDLLYFLNNRLLTIFNAEVQIQSENGKKDLFTLINEYLLAHYMDEIDRTIISFEFNISESYLSKLISRHTGVSFKKYVNKLRLKKAYELICCTDLTIEEISFQTGYNSHAYFDRMFKREYGMRPLEARTLRNTF